MHDERELHMSGVCKMSREAEIIRAYERKLGLCDVCKEPLKLPTCRAAQKTTILRFVAANLWLVHPNCKAPEPLKPAGGHIEREQRRVEDGNLLPKVDLQTFDGRECRRCGSTERSRNENRCTTCRRRSQRAYVERKRVVAPC